MLCLFYATTVPFWSDNAATWDFEPRGVHCGVVVTTPHHKTTTTNALSARLLWSVRVWPLCVHELLATRT